MVDYYRILGVSRDASVEDIKAAFRRLALKFHPDLHTNASKAEQRVASDNFKQVKEAYEVLGNERQRVVHNRDGSRPGSTSSSAYSSPYTARAGAYQSAQNRDWYKSQGSQGFSGADGFRSSDWYKATYRSPGYGGRRRGYEYSVRWNSWPVSPSEGPKMMFRATVFGIAVVTLMFMDSIGNAAWHRRNTGVLGHGTPMMNYYPGQLGASNDATARAATRHGFPYTMRKCPDQGEQ